MLKCQLLKALKLPMIIPFIIVLKDFQKMEVLNIMPTEANGKLRLVKLRKISLLI
jgi:hypothetical protein